MLPAKHTTGMDTPRSSSTPYVLLISANLNTICHARIARLADAMRRRAASDRSLPHTTHAAQF
jgi:hypothetical protein